MARLVFGGDDVDRRGAVDTAITAGTGDTVVVYTDAACTTLANIQTYPGAAAIVGSTLTVDGNSQLPEFYGPAGDVAALYVKANGGPASRIEARASEQVAVETTRAMAAEAGKQAHDVDLDAIAALDSSTAGALVTDGAGWIRKTYAQLKTALGLVKADVGLGNVDNTSDANKPVSTAQATADSTALSTATGRAVTFALIFGD